MKDWLKKNAYLVLLLLSILPYNYATLIFKSYSPVVSLIVYVIRFSLVLYIIYCIARVKLDIAQKKILQNISLYFLFIIVLNFFSCSINSSFLFKTFLKRTFSMLYMYGFYLVMIYNFKNHKNILRILKYVLIFLLLYSLTLYYLKPSVGQYYEGYNSYALLGVSFNRNSYFELMIPLFMIILFLNDQGIYKIIDIISFALCIFTIFLTKSVTGIISLFVFLFFALCAKLKFINSNFYVFCARCLFICWLLFIGLISFNIKFDSFSSLFSKKSTTLSGRTIIWQKSIYYIKKAPILGYGYDNEIIGNPTNYYDQQGYLFPNDTHNSILFLLLSSGAIGTFPYVLFLVISVKKCLYLISKDKKYVYLLAYLFAMMVRGLTESCFHYPHLFFCLMLIFIAIKYEYISNNIEQV